MVPARDTRIAPVEDNLLAFLGVMATVPLFENDEHGDVTTYRSGLPHPLFNGVVGGRFASGTEAERSRDVMAPFVDAGLPFPVYRDPGAMLLPTPAVRRRVTAVLARHGCDRVLVGAAAPLGLLAPHLRRAGARRIVAMTHGHEVWWARVPAARALLRRISRDVDVLTFVSTFCGDRIGAALTPGHPHTSSPIAPIPASCRGG